MISCEEYQLLDELLQVQLPKLDGAYLMVRKTSGVAVMKSQNRSTKGESADDQIVNSHEVTFVKCPIIDQKIRGLWHS